MERLPALARRDLPLRSKVASGCQQRNIRVKKTRFKPPRTQPTKQSRINEHKSPVYESKLPRPELRCNRKRGRQIVPCPSLPKATERQLADGQGLRAYHHLPRHAGRTG